MPATKKPTIDLPLGSVSLSLVIPVYNEVERLPVLFDAFSQPVDWGYFHLEKIIFVNDGSTDKTLALLKRRKKQLEENACAQVKIITYEQNRGKGHAIKTGMLAARTAYSLMMDADMSTPLGEVKRLQTGVRHGQAIIIGTRKSRVVRVEKEQPFWRVLMGRAFTQLSQSILNTYVSDFTCGFKLFRCDARQEIFSRSKIERWGYDSELMFLAVRLGYRPLEVAVRWRNDERSHVSVIRDAVRSLIELFQIRYFQITGQYHLPANHRRARKIDRTTIDYC